MYKQFKGIYIHMLIEWVAIQFINDVDQSQY